MALSLSPSTFIVPCFLGALILLFNAMRRSLYRLPPGPPGLPFLGNALQMPTHHEWLTYSSWGKIYGDLVHVSVFGLPMIILNSAAAIDDLFVKRGNIYSDRPVLPMAGELAGYKDSIVLRPYDADHREARKLLHTALASHKMVSIQPVHEAKIPDFLRRLLNSPDQFHAHIRHLVTSVVYQVSHGYTVANKDDPLVQLAVKANHEFTKAAAPGAFLVDMFPILRHIPDWFPGAQFKRTAKELRRTAERMKNEHYNYVKDRVSRGVAVSSFTSNIIEQNPQPTNAEEDLYKWTTIAISGAGTDTTVSAISSFFLAMMLYPDVQQKAREELDSVIGQGSLPSFSDRTKLPYIEALIKEVYRWNPVAPIAMPHRLIQDDVYNGYLIPAGSLVFGNTWGILHDPIVYSSPLEFIPERYLSSADTNPDLPDPRKFAFGYGRRVCPGQYLVDDTLFLTITSTLSMFKISNPIDQTTGLPVVTEPRYTPGVISHPEPFQCLITPRYAEAGILGAVGDK